MTGIQTQKGRVFYLIQSRFKYPPERAKKKSGFYFKRSLKVCLPLKFELNYKTMKIDQHLWN